MLFLFIFFLSVILFSILFYFFFFFFFFFFSFFDQRPGIEALVSKVMVRGVSLVIKGVMKSVV